MKKSRRLFYGWYIVAGSAFASTVSTSLSVYMAPILLKPMTAELGWTRTGFYAVQMVAIAVTGVAAPFVGRRIDRSSPRLLMLVGAVVAAASIVGYSMVPSLWLYAALAGIVTPLALSVFGAQAFNAIVSKWFVRKRGRALSISTSGGLVSGIIAPPAAVALLALMGWRLTWVVAAAVVVLVLVPVALLVRRTPEDVGQQADGELPAPAGDTIVSSVQDPEWTAGRLLRTGTFWFMVVTFGFGTMASAAVGYLLFPFFTDNGVSPGVAATLIVVASAVGIAGRPLWAYILEHWDLRVVALLTFLMWALGTFGFLVSTSVVALFVTMGLRGLASGGLAVTPMLWGHYFGRRNLGQVLGMSHMAGVPFQASGPLLMAWMQDELQSYTLGLWIAGAMMIVTCGMVMRIRPPAARRLGEVPVQKVPS